MPQVSRSLSSAVLVLSALSPLSRADSPTPPPFVEVPLMLDSGQVSASGDDPLLPRQVLFETLAHAPGAAWLRLTFAPAPITELAGDPGASNAAAIRLTSLADGASQTLTAEHLEQWGFTSAYFNGDAVHVELLGASLTAPSRIVILSAMAGQADSIGERTICQSVDDRVLSSDPRVARTSGGCTAWLFNDLNSTFITAGHCGISGTAVMMFNLPLSSSNGTVQFPPPIDQYAVDAVSNQGNSGGVGADWRYFGCFPNTESGLTAFQRQQARYTLASAAPSVSDGRPIRITGHGTVSGVVPREWNGVQKTHVGPYVALSGSSLRYHTDTTGGNSGSAVLDENANLAIGIHTHGGCSTSATSSNQGTAIQYGPLITALAAPRGVCASGRGTPIGSLFVGGDQANNFGTLDPVTGAFARVAPVSATMQGLAYDASRGVFYCVDNNRRLHAIDPDTGEAESPVALSGAAGIVNGLAFDAAASVLYGVIAGGGQLVRIDTDTGVVTAIGTPRGGNVAGLEFDPRTAVLFGIDDATAGSRLVRIDPTTGVQTVVGPLGTGSDCNGLSWGGRVPRLYTIDAATERLLRINPATGVATAVGQTLGMFGSSFGLASTLAPAAVCPADFNNSGQVSVQDLFDYVVAWCSRVPAADLDGTETFTDNDVYVFLEVYLRGGCN